MLKINRLRIRRWLLSGMLIPTLLLFGGNVPGIYAQTTPDLGQMYDTKHTVLFAVAQPNFNNFIQYNLSNVELLFGSQQDLPTTYKADVSGYGLELMRHSGEFLYVELDTIIEAARIKTNDPYFTLNDRDEDRQWYLDKIKLPHAWEYGTGSSSVVVAIVDTGIHASHLELNDGRVLAGYDATINKNIPANSNSDDNGHGTAVAGVVGAIANNNKGIAGVSWSVSLMPVRALHANGSGSVSDVAESIIWAAEHGANIINLSLGGPGFGKDQTLNNSIIYAYKRGAVIVSAVGNDLADQGVSLDSSPVYPVCADGGDNMIIGVVATDVNDQKASFSNYGTICADISAPGKKILTTAYLPSDPANNVLIYGSGTSLAAPLVSGVAALLKSNNMALTNAEIKDIILRSTDNIDSLNQTSCLNSSCNGYLGRGRLNALSALSPRPLLDGDLIRSQNDNKVYLISNRRKHVVPDFVFKQRGYYESLIRDEIDNQLSGISTGSPIHPLEGTLLKSSADNTVFYMGKNFKHAITFHIFTSRKLSFANVQTIPSDILDNIPTGNWYWPPDGTMVMVDNDPTVYIMEDGVKRPVTYFVFNQRGLSFTDIIKVTTIEFGQIPEPPDQYWLSPKDGILVKSEDDPTVYYIQDGSRKPISHEVFENKQFSYSDIKILTKAEIKAIRPGKKFSN